MKYKIKSIFVSLLLSTGLTSLGQEKVTTYVNPFIGTGAVESSLSGNNYPGATVPFGMVQLSPDTRVAPDWGEACGYNHNDQVIVGFSHTRLSGTGAADFIDILLMPMTGTPTTEAQNSPEPGTGYQSAFSHDQESARPGYYQVMLQNYGIQAELTATAWVFIAIPIPRVVIRMSSSIWTIPPIKAAGEDELSTPRFGLSIHRPSKATGLSPVGPNYGKSISRSNSPNRWSPPI